VSKPAAYRGYSKMAAKCSTSLIAFFAIAGCNASGSAPSLPSATGNMRTAAHTPGERDSVARACAGSRLRTVQCGALVRIDIAPRERNAVPLGLSPDNLESAYKLPSLTRGAGQIVAVVDAYDNPNVAADLAKYRKTFGLPKGSFSKYNQNGEKGNYPAGDTGWGVEIDLDVQMISASCPKCSVYLIEANSNGIADIEAAEAEAVKLGAHIVSNSLEGTGIDQSYFNTKGVTYVASSGDGGYGGGGGYGFIYDPADFGSVVAVGGTTLTPVQGGKRGWIETVWSGTSAGCSGNHKPRWQHDPGCANRTETDVSAEADPFTGVAEYDTYGYGGWLVTGGTSVGAPLIAGIFGLAGNATTQDGGRTFWEKEHQGSQDIFPVKSGSDGKCTPTYLCTAGTKEYGNYSGPSGWGTPNGIGAF